MASSAVQSGPDHWVFLFHYTLYNFTKPAWEEVIRRFRLHKNVVDSSLTYSTQEHIFETRCLSSQITPVTSALDEILTTFISEQSTASRDDCLILDFEEGIVDYDDFCDARSEAWEAARALDENPLVDFGQHSGQSTWSPLPDREKSIASVTVPPVLSEIAKLTGCELQPDPSSRTILIKPGVTGNTDSAVEKLNNIHQLLSYRCNVSHTLKLEQPAFMETNYVRLLDPVDPFYNFNGALSRLLVSPKSSFLNNEAQSTWPKVLSGLQMARCARLDPATKRPVPQKLEVKPMPANTNVSATRAFEVMRPRDVGKEAPSAAPPAPVHQSAPKESVQHVHEWMRNIPETPPSQPAPKPNTISQPPEAVKPASSSTSARSPPSSEPTPQTSCAPKSRKVVVSTFEETIPNTESWAVSEGKENSWNRPYIAAAADAWSGRKLTAADFPATLGVARSSQVSRSNGAPRVASSGTHNPAQMPKWPSLAQGAAVPPRQTQKGSTKNFHAAQQAAAPQWPPNPWLSTPRPASLAQQPAADQRRANGHSNSNPVALKSRQRPLQTKGSISLENSFASLNLDDTEEIEEKSEDLGPRLISTMRQRAPCPPPKLEEGASETRDTAAPKPAGRVSKSPDAAAAAENVGESAMDVEAKHSAVDEPSRPGGPENKEEDDATIVATFSMPLTIRTKGASSSDMRTDSDDTPDHLAARKALKIAREVETASVRSAIRSMREALEMSRLFRGYIDIRVEIGQIFLKYVPQDSRTSIRPETFGPFLEEVGSFESLTSNFTNMVTTRSSDLDYILDYAGVEPFDSPLSSSFLLEIDCETSSKSFVSLVVNLQPHDNYNDSVTQTEYVKSNVTVFGSWYSHHSERVWDSRLVVLGESIGQVDHVYGMKELVRSLYIRQAADNASISIQGRDGIGLGVVGVRLVQTLRYRVSPQPAPSAPGFQSPYFLELKRVSDLSILRPRAATGKQRGLFLSQTRPEAALAQMQRFWCEVSLGLIDPPEELASNLPENMEYGGKASWEADQIIGPEVWEDLQKIGSHLVRQMDNIGAANKGMAAGLEEKKRADQARRLERPDKFW